MSSNNLVARTLVLAGLVAALSLPHTARAQSVTPEQALLNRWPAMVSQGPAGAQPVIPAVIDAERALLNRSHTIIPPVAPNTSIVAEMPVDGVKALLNRSSS